jgi:hypothetical protein
MPEDSVAETIAWLTSRGYRGSFRAEEAGLRDAATGRLHRPEHLRIEALARFEGDSDPGDSAVVFALSDRRREPIGTYVVAFGPLIDRLDADAVRRLVDVRGTRRAGRRPERPAGLCTSEPASRFR